MTASRNPEAPVIPALEPARFVQVDLFGSAIKADPLPLLLRWADQPPFYVMIHNRPNVVICRYDQVYQAFNDPQTFSNVPQPGWGADTFDYFNSLPQVGHFDPPEHLRLRRLMQPAFAPRRMSQAQDSLRALVDQMMDNVAAQGSFDLMSDFAQPLVRHFLLGTFFEFPREDWHIFTDFSDVLGLVGTVPPGTPKPKAYMDRFEAGYEYCAALIEKRRGDPKDDLVGSVIRAHDEAHAITVEELFGTLIVLFAAGLGTTANALGLGVARLCRHPDQMALLRAEPALIQSAVEELLRIDTLGLFVHRFVVKDTQIGGTPMYRGMLAHLAMGAANLDPAVYPAPDQFDIRRSGRSISTFGFGPHFCIGHSLARTVLRTAIGRLVQRFPNIRLADPDAPIEYGGLPTERAPLKIQLRVD